MLKLKIKFKDEDGDFVSVTSDDDVECAFKEGLGEDGLVHLYIQG